MDKYIIVEAEVSTELQTKVNKKIEEGYVPKGGICFEKKDYKNGPNYAKAYYQAMVKK